MVQSWELELIADVTASWKQHKESGTHQIHQNTINACFKAWETHLMFSGVLLCTYTVAQMQKTAYNPETSLSAASGGKQTAASG